MEFVKLQATIRTQTGRGVVRRLRNTGLIPAVLYGKKMEAVILTVQPAALKQALAGPLRLNTVLSLEVTDAAGKDKKEYIALVRDHQYDPITRLLLHADFVAIDLDSKLTLEVPIRLTGRSAGEQVGGVLSIVHRTLQVECLPNAVPGEIVADISHLEIDDRIIIAELELPEGAKILLPDETPICSVQTPRKEEEPEKVEDEEGVEGEGAEGEGAEGAEGEKKDGDDKAKADEGKKE